MLVAEGKRWFDWVCSRRTPVLTNGGSFDLEVTNAALRTTQAGLEIDQLAVRADGLGRGFSPSLTLFCAFKVITPPSLQPGIVTGYLKGMVDRVLGGKLFR